MHWLVFPTVPGCMNATRDAHCKHVCVRVLSPYAQAGADCLIGILRACEMQLDDAAMKDELLSEPTLWTALTAAMQGCPVLNTNTAYPVHTPACAPPRSPLASLGTHTQPGASTIREGAGAWQGASSPWPCTPGVMPGQGEEGEAAVDVAVQAAGLHCVERLLSSSAFVKEAQTGGSRRACTLIKDLLAYVCIAHCKCAKECLLNCKFQRSDLVWGTADVMQSQLVPATQDAAIQLPS